MQERTDARARVPNTAQSDLVVAASLELTSDSLPAVSNCDPVTVIEGNTPEEPNLRKDEAPLKTRHGSYIASINTLPYETLAHIFTITAAFNVAPSFAPWSLPLPPSTVPDYERILSQVCSYWRRIALEVCPLWSNIFLTVGIREHDEGGPNRAEIRVFHKLRHSIRVPIHRQAGIADGPFIQTILGTIAPYKRRISRIILYTQLAERLHVALDLLIDDEPPESLVELSLSEYNNSNLPSTSSYSHKRLDWLFWPVQKLRIRSVGLDWSSVTFKALTEISLENLSPPSCPSLEVLVKALSTCPNLRELQLFRVSFPLLDSLPSQLARLEHLESLSLRELKSTDLQTIFSILSVSHPSLHLSLHSDINDLKTLECLHSFGSRANVDKISVGELFDGVCIQTALSILSAVPNVKHLVFEFLDLTGNRLGAGRRPLVDTIKDSQFPALRNTSFGVQQVFLTLSDCTIDLSCLEVFRDAISVLPLSMLILKECGGVVAGADPDKERIDISPDDEFGIRLSELMPGRIDIQE